MEVKVGVRRGVLGKKECCMTDCLKKKRTIFFLKTAIKYFRSGQSPKIDFKPPQPNCEVEKLHLTHPAGKSK